MKKFLLINILMLWSLATFAQSTVTGVVTGLDGESIPGVNVLRKGTSSGTVTDFDGKFTLSASSDDVLIFSFVGYVTEEIQVGNQSVINVTLSEDVTSLQEVVVIGYGSQKKSVATGAISSVNGDELEKINLPNVGRALQGTVSGVSVSGASGQPGSDATILIRGVGTNGDNRPLIIIDGLQGGDLSTISPTDIESIQVLKDAASTAIYGTRGANGVIYVTTKKGKAGQLQLTYNGSYFVQQAWRVPEMLSGDEYIDIINEKYENGGSTLPVGFPTRGSSAVINTNWMDQIFEPASMKNHSLTLTTGSEKSTLFSSLSYLDQQGIIAPDKSNYKRFTARLNTESKVNDYITFGENLTLIGSEKSTIPENNEFGTPIADAIVYDPLTPANDPNAQFGFGQSPYVQKEYVNPLSRIFITNNKLKSQNIYGNAYLQVKPLSWLKFKSDIGINHYNEIGDAYSPAYQLTPAFFSVASNVSNTSYSNFRLQWENYFTISKSFSDHNFEVVAGTTAIRFKEKYFGASGQNLPVEAVTNENLRYVNLTPDSTRRSYGSESPFVNNSSIFGRLLYNYKEKYLFTASVRRDGSSAFGPANRFTVFPAFSVGWVASKEDFFNIPLVDFLKVRSSFGSNGNDRIGQFQYTSLIGFNATYQFGGSGNQTVYYGADPSNLSNKSLQWEAGQQFDIGFETRLLDSKISLEFDYYKRTTKGLLLQNQATPVIAGNNPAYTNAGEVENSGFEFKIQYNKSFRDWNFGASFNGSTLKNVVTKVDGNSGFFNGYTWPVRNAVITRMDEGEPLFYFRGYKSSGIFKDQSEVFSHINNQGELLQPNAKPGDLRFEDVNGDGQIDLDDWTNIGSPWAKFTFGLNLTANYKNFDLNILFAGQTGNQIYRSFERQDVPNNNYTAEWADRWSETNPGGSYPRVTSGASGTGLVNNNSPSSFYVEDGDYIRLRNLQIGYTIPSELAQKAKIQKARIYFSADNLLTLTGYTGFDPEIGVTAYQVYQSGVDRGFYPQTKSLGAGVQITF